MVTVVAIDKEHPIIGVLSVAISPSEHSFVVVVVVVVVVIFLVKLHIICKII